MRDRDDLEAYRALSDNVRLAFVRELQAGGREAPSVPVLLAMRADEPVEWIRNALTDVLAAHGVGPQAAVLAGESLPDDDAYRQALNSAIRQVLHEIAPIVGRARLAAAQELTRPEDGSLMRELDALARVCDALRRLAAASATPNPEEVDLAECLRGLVESESRSHARVTIRASGTSPFLAVVDRALMELAVVNVLRNAVEATEAVDSSAPDAHTIVLNWGTTHGSHWVSVLDRGQGLVTSAAVLFDRGVSLKSVGRGFGLTTAVHAARSLQGDLEVGSNEQGGTTAILRWPEDLR